MSQQTIIVPWDFSEHAKAALRFARQRFAVKDIRVVCVLERPNPYATGMNWGPDVEEQAIRNCSNEFYELMDQGNKRTLHFDVVFGEPAQEIVRLAEMEVTKYVVMSTHGRTGLQRILMGSVAQRVLAQSKVPVILLPSKWFDCQLESATQSGSVPVVGLMGT